MIHGRNTAFVKSHYAIYEIDFFTGEVEDVEIKHPFPENSHLPGIFKFNIIEWSLFHNKPFKGRYKMDDIGYWYLNDKYNPVYTQPFDRKFETRLL